LFQTFPASPAGTPDRFSLAFMSCHQPLNSLDGTLSDRAMRVLRLAPNVRWAQHRHRRGAEARGPLDHPVQAGWLRARQGVHAIGDVR
jgi:hypothetical protein